jgi:hypothetical protein
MGFQGARVQAVQPDLARRELRLDFALDFRVSNPLKFPIVIPAHDYTLDLGDGAHVAGSRQAEVRLAPDETRTLSYPFTLELSAAGLRDLAGRDSAYRFTTSTDAVKAVGLQLGVSLPGLPPPFQDGKLTLTHEATLRLPLLPEVRWPEAGRAPSIELLGANVQTVDGAAALGELQRAMGPLVTALGTALTTRPSWSPSLTLGQLLDHLKVGSGGPINQRRAAISAINAARQASGLEPINEGSQIGPSLQLPSPLDLMGDTAKTQWNGLLASWRSFPPEALRRVLVVPTSLPTGVRLRMPFRLHNPNHFPIATPRFRFELAPASGGAGFARAQVVPRGGGNAATLPARAGLDMELVTEFTWSQLGGLVELARQNPTVPPVRLSGDVSVDVGYGQLTLPIQLGGL